jgi:hypothetical protein
MSRDYIAGHLHRLRHMRHARKESDYRFPGAWGEQEQSKRHCQGGRMMRDIFGTMLTALAAVMAALVFYALLLIS